MKSISTILICIFLPLALFGQTNPAPQALPYSQDFSSLPHNSSNYPSGIQGWRIGYSSTSYSTAPPLADRNLIISSYASASTNGIHNYNGKIGFLNSNINDNSIALAINSIGKQDIQVDYQIMVIRNPYDGTANTWINESTLQYRIGTDGDFTPISGVEYQNGTTLQINNTVNPQNPQLRSLALPASCNDQAVVQIRWISRDISGSGYRPSFAIDDVSILGDPITLPVELTSFSVTAGANNNACISWITQSETGVNGFYVLRGLIDDLNEAAIISPLISAANTSTTQSYYYRDDELTVACLYYYWLQSVDFNGTIGYFGPSILSWNPEEHGNPSPPLDNALRSVYPNPFNPSATIVYALKEAAPVQVIIYNTRGQQIRSFDLGMTSAAEHSIIWNGRSDRGDACPSGVYRIVLKAGNHLSTLKALLLK